LFADYLRSEDQGEGVKTRHARAARWFEEHGYSSEGLDHYCAAGDMSSALRVVQATAGDLVRLGELSTLLAWIDRLERNVLASTDWNSTRERDQVLDEIRSARVVFQERAQ
jgi:ATP/maltotriose-dependent transcriptional regulator MalT